MAAKVEVHVASPLRSVHNREITTLCPSDSSRLEQRRRERTKSRAGVHKENTGSVRDTVKKFSAAGGAGSPEVKRIVRPKNSVRKSSLTESETAKPKTASPKITRGEKTVTPVKQRKPVPSRPPLPAGKGRQPTSTETASHHQKVHKAEATVSEVPPAETLTSEVPPANTSSSELPPAENSTSELPPTGNLELPKDKESGPPQATMEVDSPVHHRILKDTTSTLTAEVKDTAPPAEEDEQKSTAELAFERLMTTHSPEKEAEEGERKEEEPAPSVHPVEEPEESVNGEQGEDVPRALKLISAFEQKKSTAAAETPPWKKNLREELHSNLGEEASKPEEEEKPHRAANLPPKPKPVPVPRAVRAKSPEPSKTSEPPKATPRVPKAPPRPSEPPKATPKASEPPKAVPQFSEPPKETPKQVNGEMSQPAAPSKDEVDGGLFSKPPAGETSNKSTVGDSNKVNLREKQPIRRFHSATDTSEGNKTAPASGLGIIDKRSSWMPKQEKKREDCAVCGRAVYAMERLEADKVVYHKTCFKCSVCRKTLSTGTYAALQGKIYCKVHFKQLFKIKGNYDEGFGREQHKTKWIKKEGQSEC